MPQKLLNIGLFLLGAAAAGFVWEIGRRKRKQTGNASFLLPEIDLQNTPQVTIRIGAETMPTINIQHVTGHNNRVNGSCDWQQNANYEIPPSAIAEVRAMLDQIHSAVAGVSPEQRAKSKEILQATQQLQKAIDAPAPNSHEIHLSAKGLIEAAQALAVVVPIASDIIKALFPY
jgi:hypothetical protein